MITSDWAKVEACKVDDAKCFCGRRNHLIVYCGFYVCVWCKAGAQVSMKLTGSKLVRRVALQSAKVGV